MRNNEHYKNIVEMCRFSYLPVYIVKAGSESTLNTYTTIGPMYNPS